MKKIIFVCMLMVFNSLLFSCGTKNDTDDELYNKTETQFTGDENNDIEPEDEINKPKT